MARWEPNARERLVRAALDLFSEQGYDATTVTQIAERAGGLTKTTFFRHFPDKREVLFAGQEIHSRALTEGAEAAPAQATPLETVAAALDALTATFTEDRRDIATRIRPVIAANSELQERSAFKSTVLTETLRRALCERGTPEPAAGVAADLGIRAFHRAFELWSDPANPQSLTALGRESLGELRAAVRTLS